MCVCVCVCVRAHIRVCVCILRGSGGGGCCCFFFWGGEGEGQRTNFKELDMKHSSSGLCFTMLHTAKLHTVSSSIVELL